MNTKIYSRKYDFIVNTGSQRKSGDPATFLFNTLVVMCLFANCYNLDSDNIICAVFGGDDSLLVVEPGTELRPID